MSLGLGIRVLGVEGGASIVKSDDMRTFWGPKQSPIFKGSVLYL